MFEKASGTASATRNGSSGGGTVGDVDDDHAADGGVTPLAPKPQTAATNTTSSMPFYRRYCNYCPRVTSYPLTFTSPSERKQSIRNSVRVCVCFAAKNQTICLCANAPLLVMHVSYSVYVIIISLLFFSSLFLFRLISICTSGHHHHHHRRTAKQPARRSSSSACRRVRRSRQRTRAPPPRKARGSVWPAFTRPFRARRTGTPVRPSHTAAATRRPATSSSSRTTKPAAL